MRRCIESGSDVDGTQAQWEYFDSSGFEPYPDEINVIIEKAYQEKKAVAEWEEENARYRLTFETMEEEMSNNASSKVRVRRNTKGDAVNQLIHWSVNQLTCMVICLAELDYCKVR